MSSGVVWQSLVIGHRCAVIRSCFPNSHEIQPERTSIPVGDNPLNYAYSYWLTG